MQDSSLIFLMRITFYCNSFRDLEFLLKDRKNFLTAKSWGKVIEAANKLCDLSLVTNVNVSGQKLNKTL